MFVTLVPSKDMENILAACFPRLHWYVASTSLHLAGCPDMLVQAEQQNTDSINEVAENPFVQSLTTMNTRKLFPVSFRETHQLVDNTISKLGT
jgi:hypothetical protein